MSTFVYEEKATQRYFRGILCDRINLCGCGSGTNFEVLLAMLERAESHEGKVSKSFYDSLGDICPRGVEFIAHVVDGWSLIDHGSGIGWAWLTDDGKAVLEFLRKFGTDKDTWPEWWCSCEAGEEW
jgi:hypothetical protein